MADISGPGGTITMGQLTIHFSGWNATLNPTIVENTGFAEMGNRTYLATAQNITGAGVGTGTDANPSIPSGLLGSTPTMSTYSGTVFLQSTTNKTASFTGLVSAIALNRPADGKFDVAASFISSGPITGNL